MLDGLASFKSFLKSEFSEENLEFWMACEDYNKIKSPVKMAEMEKKIYEEFIQAEAPKEVGPDWKGGESGQWGSAQQLPRKDFHLQYSLQLKVIPI